ncbi:MAG: tetratricopeptide repeat protein [Pseudomonadota bacterium]
MNKSTSRKKPAGLDQALRAAMTLHQGGQLAQAEQAYRTILAIAPRHPDLLHYLGVALHQQGKRDEALGLIARALALAPGYIDARNNLGNVQKEMGLLAEAEQSYRAVLAARPDYALAHNNLGIVLKEQGRHAEAVAAYRQCLVLRPDYADGWINLGNALKKCGDLQETMTAYRQAIMLAPQSREAHRNLGRALGASGRHAEALDVYRQWLVVDPGNPVVEHMIAACAGAAAPERASDAFLQQTFDGFAASFDEVLTRLDYRAPALCGQMVQALLGAPPGEGARLAVLDAGCGTGLCAPHLKPYARQLIGVDLSPGMLAKAALRGDYDVLEAAELTAWLDANARAYDLIVSADTLCYFGILDAVFAAAAKALRHGGHLVFTVEQTVDEAASPSFLLHPHGRYSHARTYVEQGLLAAGLKVIKIEMVTLRKEADKPVVGLLVGARRPLSA